MKQYIGPPQKKVFLGFGIKLLLILVFMFKLLYINLCSKKVSKINHWDLDLITVLWDLEWQYSWLMRLLLIHYINVLLLSFVWNNILCSNHVLFFDDVEWCYSKHVCQRQQTRTVHLPPPTGDPPNVVSKRGRSTEQKTPFIVMYLLVVRL